MDFDWTPTQAELYERALHFARKQLGLRRPDPQAVQPAFDKVAWKACGDFGILGLCIDEEYDGLGLDSLTTARILEAVGRGAEDMGLVFAASAHLFACTVPVAEHGSTELRERFLPKMSKGAVIAANAATEAEAGSDIFAMKTTAVRDGDEYVLQGEKTYVTNGPVADVFLAYAATAPSHGYFGISAFLVERDRPGIVVGSPFDKIGLTSALTSTVYFDGCRVPARNRLAEEGQGAMIFERSMAWERSCLFAAYLGLMERQLERTIDHVKQRKQFGRRLSENQGVAFRITDMKHRLEAARLLLYRACWLRDQGERATLEVSLAKLAVSEAAVQSGLDAIQLHGGSGVMEEYGVERMLRDAIPCRIFSGTSEMQRSIIARELGL
jgi:alkylation response protein AidB-like acyl-CoA dehydrogenase